ncbi:hypothetical protein GCM10010420_02540 [Streptomyces glaucosporus]|uniref:Uncharacterized protein n=1 Tax=Streptomyces glaucosporus TaxID=284044 RepID=A0ABP5UMK7_9ACTN
MPLRDGVVARQVCAYLLDAEENARPQPVDNPIRSRLVLDLAARRADGPAARRPFTTPA